MKVISLKQMFRSILNRQDEDTMWSAIRTFTSGKANRFVHLAGSDDKKIYLCTKGNEHIMMMLDNSMSHKSEMANEDTWCDMPYPTYNTTKSERISPVYELYSCMSAFCQHCAVEMPNVMGILLTDSEIVNAKDMEEGWRSLRVIVKDALQSVETNQKRLRCDEIPEGSKIAAFKDSIRDNMPLHDTVLYYAKFQEEPDDDEAVGWQDIDKLPKRVNIAAWVEDDPDFYDTLPGGQKVLSIPNVQVFRRESNPMRELRNLIGLKGIKQKIDQFASLASYNVLMSDLSIETQGLNLHALFAGGVGVGKTTVARLYASLLYDNGLLSTGQVVVADRSSFIDKYWGQTEHNVHKILKLSQGGVLFIDESYLLASPDERDPGRIVIQMLMDTMADQNNRDIAIVLAGYPDKMQDLLNINPGLTSRIPNVYLFSDFTINELNSIAEATFGKVGYILTEEASALLQDQISAAYEVRNAETWGNAREIQNLYEATILQHAERCMKEGLTSKDVQKLITIEPEDIPVFRNNTNQGAHATRIGFK